MKAAVTRFLKDESGAQIVEYALLAVLIAILLVGAVVFLSGAIRDAFDAISNCVSNNVDCPS